MCSRMDGRKVGKKASLTNICHTYPTMMKPDGPENINHVRHPLRSADISIFHRKSATFLIILIFLKVFLKVFRGCFNKHCYNFDNFKRIEIKVMAS